ncbi:MAG: hypothetical protein MK078_02765 [Crocinitomicaceae bacterium]|nr:hypothetical protein [Crocinitomicaceae bacterium]
MFKENVVDSKKHKTYKFWKRGNFAIAVRSNRMLLIKINYIHQNPVKANFVKYAEDWEYSSAYVYADLIQYLNLHRWFNSLEI